MTAGALAELERQMEPGPPLGPDWTRRGDPVLLQAQRRGHSLVVFSGTETAPQGIAEVWFMGFGGSRLVPARGLCVPRSFGHPGGRPWADGEVAVLRLTPFEGQTAYVVEHGVFNGHAFCSRSVEAGLLQRRYNPATATELAVLASWSRLVEAQETICVTTLPRDATSYRFEYAYPDGRSIPGFNASSDFHNTQLILDPDLSGRFWDGLTGIIENS